MSGVRSLSVYARQVFLRAPSSAKLGIRNVSRHLWPGSQAFLSIAGITHFNEDNEVDRLALSFLNENVISDAQSIESSAIENRKLDGKFSEQALRGEDTYNQMAEDLRKLTADGETPKINCSDEINTSIKEPLKVTATTGLSVTSLDQSNKNQNNSHETMKGVYKDFSPKLNEFAIESDSVKHLPNKCQHQELLNEKELNQEDYSNAVRKEDMQPNLKKPNDIKTYKPFQTIEVQFNTPSKDESIPKQTEFDFATKNMSTDEETQQEIQTVLDDTKSRILMRYALLKALYVLKSGGTHCKAKIIFRNPKKN